MGVSKGKHPFPENKIRYETDYLYWNTIVGVSKGKNSLPGKQDRIWDGRYIYIETPQWASVKERILFHALKRIGCMVLAPYVFIDHSALNKWCDRYFASTPHFPKHFLVSNLSFGSPVKIYEKLPSREKFENTITWSTSKSASHLFLQRLPDICVKDNAIWVVIAGWIAQRKYRKVDLFIYLFTVIKNQRHCTCDNPTSTRSLPADNHCTDDNGKLLNCSRRWYILSLLVSGNCFL